MRFVHSGPEKITRKMGPALSLEEISGRLPGCADEVCWIVRRFVPVDLQDTAAATREKRTRAKKKVKAAPQRTLQPALGWLTTRVSRFGHTQFPGPWQENA